MPYESSTLIVSIFQRVLDLVWKKENKKKANSQGIKVNDHD